MPVRNLFLAFTLGALTFCENPVKNVEDAICSNNAGALEKLLSSGASANELILDNFNLPPLVLVVDDPGCGHPPDELALLKVLLLHGAMVDGTTPGGRTALMAAVGSNLLDAVKLLIANGADVNKQDQSGKTALLHISSATSLEIVQLLLQIGAEFTVKSNDGNTPAHWAKQVGNKKVAEFLLSKEQ